VKVKELSKVLFFSGGLGGEKARWSSAANALQGDYDSLAGDILICCGVICYLSPFTSSYR
jgi:dynein heavy chain